MTEEYGFFSDSHNSKEPSKMSGEKPSSCTPLTIRQILGARKTNEKYHVDGKELLIVEVLGQVMSISSKNNFRSFQLDDSTGSFEVKIFNDTLKSNEFVNREIENVREGQFVKFFGNISEWKDRISLNAFTLKLVTDPNEIYFHMLECIQVHLFNTRGPPEITTQSDAMNTSVSHHDSSFNFGSSRVQQDASAVDLEEIKNDIMRSASQVIPPNRRRTGAIKDDILDPLASNYSTDDLEIAFSSLIQEGMIYNTTDNDHFTIN